MVGVDQVSSNALRPVVAEERKLTSGLMLSRKRVRRARSLSIRCRDVEGGKVGGSTLVRRSCFSRFRNLAKSSRSDETDVFASLRFIAGVHMMWRKDLSEFYREGGSAMVRSDDEVEVLSWLEDEK